MASLHRHAIFALIWIAIAGLAACSTGPQTVADDTDPVDLESAEELIQSDDVVLAAGVDIERLPELTPLLQRMAQTIDEPAVRQFADISPDPLSYLETNYGLTGDLSALDPDEPTYVLVTDRGNRSFLEATDLGLPTDLDDWPTYVNVRVLVPTDDPETLSRQLDTWLTELSTTEFFDAFELFDEAGFVRVELAVSVTAMGTSDAIDAEQWLAELELDGVEPAPKADRRPTPAFDAVVDSDAAVRLWSPAESLRIAATLELLEIFAGEYHMVSEAGQPRFFLEGIARLAAASYVDDPLTAEFEDFALLLDDDGDATFFVDFYATRTSQGQAMREQRSASIDLPEVVDLDSFVDVRARADFAGIDEGAEFPLWSDHSEIDDLERSGVDAVDESFLPFSDDPARLLLLTPAFQYPWTTVALFGESVDLIPLPSGLDLHIFEVAEDIPAPAGATVAATFDDEPATANAIQILLRQIESFMPGMVDAELAERADGLLEVRLAIGRVLADTFGTSPATAPVEGTELSIDVAALQRAIPGLVGVTDALDLFGQLHLRSDSRDHYTAHRLAIGSSQPVAPDRIDSRLESLATFDDRCRTEFAATAIQYLSDLRTRPADRVDQWAEYLEQKATQCFDDQATLERIQQRIDAARHLAEKIP